MRYEEWRGLEPATPAPCSACIPRLGLARAWRGLATMRGTARRRQGRHMSRSVGRPAGWTPIPVALSPLVASRHCSDRPAASAAVIGLAGSRAPRIEWHRIASLHRPYGGCRVLESDRRARVRVPASPTSDRIGLQARAMLWVAAILHVYLALWVRPSGLHQPVCAVLASPSRGVKLRGDLGLADDSQVGAVLDVCRVRDAVWGRVRDRMGDK